MRLKVNSDIEKLPVIITHNGIQKRALGGDTTMDRWSVCIDTGKYTFYTDYFTGLAHRRKLKSVSRTPRPKNAHGVTEAEYLNHYAPQKPKIAGVLHSLLLDADCGNQNFDDWCAGFGYSNDSIKAEEMHRACMRTASELRKLFDGETIERLRELLQDY
jgi:hypothetical protein